MKLKNLLFSISLISVALLFIFSGLSKAINPFGFSNQIADYLAAVGITIDNSDTLLPAILICGAEILLGILLLTRIGLKTVATAALLTMIFFTALTTWIAIANPVSDCGCFGEVLKVSNTATLIKNIVLLILTVVIFGRRKDFEATKRAQNKIVIIVAVLMSLVPGLYFSANLPMLDATPYKIGVDVPNTLSNQVDEDSAEEILLRYRNKETGDECDFNLEDTTWHNSAKWEYVSTLEGGNDIAETTEELSTRPVIPMLTARGDDISEIVLSGELPLMIIISPKLNFINTPKLNELKINHLNKGGRVILLTAMPLTEVPIAVEAFNSDNTTLKTIIQNYQGGVLLLQNGVITHKWAMQRIPHISPITDISK